MSAPDQVYESYVAMWNATDEMRCRELAGQVFTEDAIVRYPSFEATGQSEIVAVATQFHLDSPGVRIVLMSGVEYHHGWIRAAWRAIDADGSALYGGQTILELTDDGRVRRAVGFRDPLPGRP